MEAQVWLHFCICITNMQQLHLSYHFIDRCLPCCENRSMVTLALTILTSSQAILIVWSKRAGKYEYSVTTANFLVRVVSFRAGL